MARLCTLATNMEPTLQYVEKPRQCMACLPCINPSFNSLLVFGCSKARKTSFLKRIITCTLPFEVNSSVVSVGYTDYKYQVIEVSEHVLDGEEGERILGAITRLRAVVIFILDASGACCQGIAQQVSLFRRLRSCLVGKPISLVCKKIDLRPMANITGEDWDMLKQIEGEASCTLSSVRNPLF
ncbi:hypothetical protein AMTR_s00008p00137370 [Amborella trichopoda]|uniref:Nucleolar GTP-binding protein 1 Rossman-fold domain-containing protein n=1 Tax=Amborella trichopoda TaxID=13333 RepID=W1NIN5_AMBTC|nr:hypothetical protein AMTR_s00008p00137370 [Amborella trichopoda]